MSTKLTVLITFLFILLFQSPAFSSDTNHKVEDQNQPTSENIDEDEDEDEDIKPSNSPGKSLSTLEDEGGNFVDDEEDN